ncbi:MAG: helix-turn-helix domain-containing protein [Nitrososphaerales archaeon]|jgi:sugar-specific transcriptional regulator TrmB
MMQNPSFDARFLSLLEELGLTQQEALVYSTLLNLGGSPAKKVAEATQIAREHTYQVLKRLQAKGLVDVVLADQLLFVPAKPRAAVGFFVSRIDDGSRELKEKAYEAGAWLQTIASRTPGPDEETRPHPESEIRMVHGRRVAHEFELELSGCKEECLVLQALSSFRTSDGLRALERLKHAGSRGVSVTILTDTAPYRGDPLGPLSRELNFRCAPACAGGPRFVVFDRSRAMQTLTPSGHGELRSLCSTNPEMVSGLVHYFEMLLPEARTVRNR